MEGFRGQSEVYTKRSTCMFLSVFINPASCASGLHFLCFVVYFSKIKKIPVTIRLI